MAPKRCVGGSLKERITLCKSRGSEEAMTSLVRARGGLGISVGFYRA
jgi:hypothetical protein